MEPEIDLSKVSLGLWSMLPKRMLLDPDYWRWVAEDLQFDLVAIMIDSSDRDPMFTFSPRDAEKVLMLADPHAIDVAWTTWPWPDKDQIDAQCQQMDAILDAAPKSRSWETDEEFNWDEDTVAGFGPVKVTREPQYIEDVPILPSSRVPIGGTKSAFDVAGDYFVHRKREVCQGHGIFNEMTSFTYHQENGPKADTVEDVDTVLVQAYSCDERNGKQILWSHRYGPGNMQELTLGRTKTIPAVAAGRTKMGCGHAAWKQRFKRRKGSGFERVSPSESMRVAFETACRLGAVDHRWWVDSHAYPKSRAYNGYAEAFLKTLRAA